MPAVNDCFVPPGEGGLTPEYEKEEERRSWALLQYSGWAHEQKSSLWEFRDDWSVRWPADRPCEPVGSEAAASKEKGGREA